MKLWTYIKSLNETVWLSLFAIVAILIFVSFFYHPKIDESIFPEMRQNSISKFKCPNEYKTSEDYVENLVKWIKVKTETNPNMTYDEIQGLRDKELAEHKCDPSHWVLEEDVDWIGKVSASFIEDESVDWNLDVVVAETPYRIYDAIKDGDLWLAHYNATEPILDGFDSEITMLYFPPDFSDSNGNIFSIEDIADLIYQKSEDNGAIIHNPFYVDPLRNSKWKTYILPAYYLYPEKNYGDISLAVIKEDNLGILAITYSKRITSEAGVTSVEKKILKWLLDHDIYFGGLDKFKPSDFFQIKDNARINKVKEAIKYAESLEPSRLGESPSEEEIYNNPYIKHIRLALNGYLNGTNTGVEKLALNDFGEGDCGLNTFDRSYYNSKFVIFNANDGDYGGVEANIVFIDKPDTIFWAWVYRLDGDGEYVLRAFCSNGPSEEHIIGFKGYFDDLIKTTEHPL